MFIGRKEEIAILKDTYQVEEEHIADCLLFGDIMASRPCHP